jgi:digeranylgeranylglycerophospholipid reductase
MKSSYDVIVVGAGPAGSVAARRAAEAGLDVLLIEKRREIGAPVRCAEAVGSHVTEPYIALDERWIDAHIDSYAICGTDGASVIVPPTEPTLVVNRKVFDFELACVAMDAGAEVVAGASAVELVHDNGRIAGVIVQHLGCDYTVRTRLIVAADGTESQVARWAGLKTVPPMGDFYTCIQFLLGGIQHRFGAHVCEYHVGASIAPGGYVWVFPKGRDRANVGIAVSGAGAKGESPQDYLERFVHRHFPEASLLSIVTGGIPITGAVKRMVADGVVVVGDAAHQADPLTAGGINLAMFGADMAMRVAIPALRRGDVSAHALSEYERLWAAEFGKQHSALYRVRKILSEMSETTFNQLVASAARLPLADMSVGQILGALLKEQPRLLVEVGVLAASHLILK